MAETGTPPASAAELDRVAARALALCAGARVIGLGSGRAATAFIRGLGAEVKAGRSVRRAPTSEATARLARAGHPLAGLGRGLQPTTVDRAARVDHGSTSSRASGALVRERIIGPSRRAPDHPGGAGAVPCWKPPSAAIEVIAFALPLASRRLAPIAGAPTFARSTGGVHHRQRQCHPGLPVADRGSGAARDGDSHRPRRRRYRALRGDRAYRARGRAQRRQGAPAASMTAIGSRF